MDSGNFKLVVSLILAGRIWSLPVGCRYNESSYQEGELVQVAEPCLSCVCRRGGLVCSLRVCADYPESLPAGCFFIYKADECCPQLLCEDGFIPNGIEFRTGTEVENKGYKNGCLLNGTIYGKGSAVASQDPCEYCYCTEGGLRCVRPRCTRTFEGCTAVYEKFSCCPTRFDCRDAKVSYLRSSAKHLDTNSESHKAPFKTSQRDKISEELEERITESLVASPAEEATTEGSTFEAQLETTTSLSADHPTTLSFQTTETGSALQKSLAAGSTKETIAEVSSILERVDGTEGESKSRRKEENEQGSGDGDRSRAGEPELAGIRLNATQVSEDYDSYDYAEPKLPPSLPNLVIFPFVAADAIVKDGSGELYKEAQIERSNDRPVTYRDNFSPPAETEGGFVPKQPSFDPFYKIPFLMETRTAPTAEEKQRASQGSITHRIHDESDHFLDDGEMTEFTSEGTDLKHLEGTSISLKEMHQLEVAPELFATKPVTVAYKNIIVDFYPDRQVTVAKGQSTVQPPENSASEKSFMISPGTPVPLNMSSASAFDLFRKADSSDKPTEKRVLEKNFSTAESTSENPYKTLLAEISTPTLTTSTTSAKHKYSSKIKGFVNTTTKSKGGNHTENVDVKAVDYRTPSADAHHLPTFAPFSLDRITIENPEVVDEHLQDSVHGFEGAFAGKPAETNFSPGALLKLAGCNIYGMMYRIGKIIAELSGPCVECFCTETGVQCNALLC